MTHPSSVGDKSVIDNELSISSPVRSKWHCEIFGDSQIIWNPEKGKVPSWWVRFRSKVFFNCKWRKYGK